MSKAESAHHHDVTGNTIFGFWVYLMTDFILFATLFAAYVVLKQGVAGGPSPKDLFSAPLALTETLILLTSSLTCGIAISSVQRGETRKGILWYGMTFLLGLAFLIFVGSELGSIVQEGATWKTSAFLSSYFALVGTHALHIFFALLFMIVFCAQLWCWGFTESVQRRLICLSLFWFFSYVVWIFMYTIVYLMEAV